MSALPSTKKGASCCHRRQRSTMHTLSVLLSLRPNSWEVQLKASASCVAAGREATASLHPSVILTGELAPTPPVII